MFRALLVFGLVFGVAVVVPNDVSAQSTCNNCGKCGECAKVRMRPCTKCRKPRCHCVCVPVPMTTKPVYETCYRKEQQVTQRQFVETHYRDEMYLETVPVTKIDCVTVDEGCYQQIWVPKIVTKQVPRTEYVSKTACRQVPYQVTRCVPEMTTKMVPYQRVRYVQTPSTCIPGLMVGTSSYPPSMCGAPGIISPQPHETHSPVGPVPPRPPTPVTPQEVGPMPPTPGPQAPMPQPPMPVQPAQPPMPVTPKPMPPAGPTSGIPYGPTFNPGGIQESRAPASLNSSINPLANTQVAPYTPDGVLPPPLPVDTLGRPMANPRTFRPTPTAAPVWQSSGQRSYPGR